MTFLLADKTYKTFTITPDTDYYLDSCTMELQM